MSAPRTERSRRGSALIVAAAVVAVVGILAAVLAVAVAGAARAGQRSVARQNLEAAAESGAELAIGRLAANASWTGAQGLPVPGGTCDVTVKQPAPDRFEIVSTAASPQGQERCTVRVGLRPAAGGSFRVTSWEMRRATGGK